MIRCLFGHRPVTVEGEQLGLQGCSRCGDVFDVWTLFRPEIAIRAQREHDRVRRDRERRAAAMHPPTRRQNLHRWVFVNQEKSR
jgi:hypothetical protein